MVSCMDDFKQTLRKIQKYERSNGDLAKIDETFYNELYKILEEFKEQFIRDPFYNSSEFKTEILFIGSEICQRREHKITDAAVVNIHRQYPIFLDESNSDSEGVMPLNLTFSEKKLYFSLINLFKQYREDLISNNDDCFDIDEPNFNITLSSEHIDNVESTTTDFTEANLESNSLVDNLEKIANLYEKGFLTDDEFIMVKQRIFGKN